MLNILATERMKLRRDKLMLVCSLIAVLLPIFMVWYEFYSTGGAMPDEGVVHWVSRYSLMYQLIVYPVLSGLVFTFSLHREYGDQTLINTLTAPVGRAKFLLGKIIVWTVWHISITAAFLAIMCVSVSVFYGSSYLFAGFAGIASLVMKSGLLNLGTLTPIIWVAVLQRKPFYPSLVCAMVFAGIGFMGLYGPELLGNIVPWIAVVFINVGIKVIPEFAYTSIALCFIFGLFMAMRSFRRQDL